MGTSLTNRPIPLQSFKSLKKFYFLYLLLQPVSEVCVCVCVCVCVALEARIQQYFPAGISPPPPLLNTQHTHTQNNPTPPKIHVYKIQGHTHMHT